MSIRPREILHLTAQCRGKLLRTFPSFFTNPEDNRPSFSAILFPAVIKGLLQVILRYLLVAIIAVTDINIVQIAATLATLLGSPRLPLYRQPRSTLGAVGRIRKVLEMATRAGEVDVEA
jgi:hypothetical protein